ncbi:Vacuolar ATP synthase subunit S1 [Aphelenchoides besseyi]|nr:Vacuolar ATP synthase subunit S1 [Aphelenchoides besseyi]
MFKQISVFLILFCESKAHDYLIRKPADGNRLVDEDPRNVLKNSIHLASSMQPTYIVALKNFSLDNITSAQKLFVDSHFLRVSNFGTLEVPSNVISAENGVYYEEYKNLDEFLDNFLPSANSRLFVLSNSNAFVEHGVRVKRVTLNDEELEEEEPKQKQRKPQRPSAKTGSRVQNSRSQSSSRRLQQGKSYSFPIVLPPFNRGGLTSKNAEPKWGSCLLYLETVVVYVFNKKSEEPFGCGATIGSSGDHKFIFTSDSVNCVDEVVPGKPQSFSFNIDISVGKPVEAKCRDETMFTVDGVISAKLTFETNSDSSWSLVAVETDGLQVNGNSENWLNKDLSVGREKANEINVKNLNIEAPWDYNFGCSRTKTAVFSTNDDDYEIGLAFENFQIQPSNYLVDEETGHVRFTLRTQDCVGVFSAASLMGIIVSLILAMVFIFGFLMLNSVQSVGRFDDPKQKQLVINAKE